MRAQGKVADDAFRDSATPLDLGSVPNKSGELMLAVPQLPNPTPEQITKVMAALSTRDPSAISSLGPMLGKSFKTGEFQFGQANEVLLRNLRELMWPMLACQFGVNCSAQNNRELFSSANHNPRVRQWRHT